MRPGVEVLSRAQPVPRTAPTDTGVAFMVGTTLEGTDVALVRSLTEYVAAFGDRQGATAAYDAAETYFREGGARLYVSPIGTGVARSRSRNAKSDDEAATPQLVDVNVQAALDALNKSYGPGQVFVADDALATTPDTHAALLAHAQATNRVALLEAPAATDAATLAAVGTALQANVNARYGALFAPHATIAGVAAGTTRAVGYACLVAGMIARSDATNNPTAPAAGVNGVSLSALDLTEHYTDAEYETLNEAGVDLARLIYGGVETYGWRSCVDPDGADKDWLNFGNARLNMAITAQAEAIGEHYVFVQLDGRRRKISQFGGELAAMLDTFYVAGGLYGETGDDAYRVNVGDTVNTDATIANGELHAILEVRMSPFAELVVIEIVKVATSEALAA